MVKQVICDTITKKNNARLAVMLTENGKLKGDLTCFNWGNGTYWIMGSYYLRQWHMRWFKDNLPANSKNMRVRGSVLVNDISDNICGYAISGPNSRKVISELTNENMSNEEFKFMKCKEVDIGLIRAKVGRLSVSGELGYEINCHALEMSSLREMLLRVGNKYNIREYGYYALNSLRMEKSFGIWNSEFMQAYTPMETRMDRWINYDKDVNFIGKKSFLIEKEKNVNDLEKILVTLEIENAESEAVGYEPIWDLDGNRIGMTTSGGYGYSVKKSLAMALIEPKFMNLNSKLKTHIVGVEKNCFVIANSPWDPSGKRMRQ